MPWALRSLSSVLQTWNVILSAEPEQESAGRLLQIQETLVGVIDWRIKLAWEPDLRCVLPPSRQG